MKNNKKGLSHVLWIGGAADSGKTTISRWFVEKKGYQRYSADKTGRDHLEKLVQTGTKHEKYIKSVLAEHWTGYTAREIAEHALAISRERFQFVIEDIKELSKTIPVIAEGVAFTPEIVQSVLISEYQAIWLVPTKEMMETSFRRKVRFLASRMGHEAKTTINVLLQANMHLMAIIQSQANQYGYKVYQVVRTRSVEENAAAVWAHFSQYMTQTSC